MKILLFGGSGLLGGELLRALQAHTVSAPSHADVVITDSVAVEKIMEEVRPDFVINTAAIIDVNALERDPELGWKVNAEGAGIVARGAAARAVPQLFMSTSYVFASSTSAYSEKAQIGPTNVYGKTKAQGEDLVKEYAGTGAYYIVRTSWIYSSLRKTFVDEVAKKLQRGETFEASPQLGSPTYARELAEVITTNFIEKTPKSGIYHLVNEGGPSRFEIAREIADSLLLQETLVVAKDFPSSAARPSVILKNTKLPPMQGWQLALRGYIEEQYGHQ